MNITVENIESWLWQARDLLVKREGHPQTWWPKSGKSRENASAWAGTFFLTASRACLGSVKQMCVSAGWNSGTARLRSLDEDWLRSGGTYWPHENMVDFSVHDWNNNKVFLVAGESECDATQPASDFAANGHAGYSWDFFKLLTVPSPIRLFFALIGTRERDVTVTRRIDELEKTLKASVQTWGGQLIRHGDEIGIVLLSATKERREDSCCLAYSGKKWHEARLDVPPLFKKDLPKHAR